HLAAKQRAIHVERLELLDRDAVGRGALPTHLVRPQLRAAEDRVRVDGVGADADRPALEGGDTRELNEPRLRDGVRPEAGAGGERVLRRDVDEAAADALLREHRPDAFREQEVAREVDLEAAPPLRVA